MKQFYSIELIAARVSFVAIALLALVLELRRERSGRKPAPLVAGWVLLWAGVNVVFMLYLFWVRSRFPLFLEMMEGTVLQHVRRLSAAVAIYPVPGPDFVPLAYNPLYYIVSLPFTWMLGSSLFALRTVSILAMTGSAALIYSVVRRRTESVWWGAVAVGLFAGAYRVMDAYLDTAHSDSCFLFAALFGTWIIERDRSRLANAAGVFVLVLSFWFKQHGVWFAIGGLLYLTLREGVRRSILYWALAAVTGPVVYLLLGNRLFGPEFVYFTWQVPSAWLALSVTTFLRFIGTAVIFYAVLSVISVWTALGRWARKKRNVDVWTVQLVFALLTGFMGTLDPESANNVYIAEGVWFIIIGTIGMRELGDSRPAWQRYRLPLLATAVSFALMMYDPGTVTIPSTSEESYSDLLAMLHRLDGTVYAPSLGQLESGFSFSPATDWVALDDMIRGPGKDRSNNPLVESLLAPATHPSGRAYILANYPLGVYPVVSFLQDYYLLEEDFGDRFIALRSRSGRWETGWPRYLYRYVGGQKNLGRLDAEPWQDVQQDDNGITALARMRK